MHCLSTPLSLWRKSVRKGAKGYSKKMNGGNDEMILQEHKKLLLRNVYTLLVIDILRALLGFGE